MGHSETTGVRQLSLINGCTSENIKGVEKLLINGKCLQVKHVKSAFQRGLEL